MARKSKWSADDRKKLLKMVDRGVPEQDIREQYVSKNKAGKGVAMTAVEFAQQLKTAMVEAGRIKQTKRKKTKRTRVYLVTEKGRLTVADFSAKAGVKPGDRFVLRPPRGKSKTWRLEPAE